MYGSHAVMLNSKFIQGLTIAITASIFLSLLAWMGNKIFKLIRIRYDALKIFKWLKNNTKNEPHESHKSIVEIISATHIPEERVRIACLKSKRIFHSIKQPGAYSIWRQEPQSIYEKRGIISF